MSMYIQMYVIFILYVFNDSSWTYTSFLTSSFSECETYKPPPPPKLIALMWDQLLAL